VLYFRGFLAVVMVGCGLVILARMLAVANAGFAIVPGVLLGAAMIALGIHRISLILRIRKIT
jgi:hypothetical protein